MSWKPEVKTPGDIDWTGNTVIFETAQEAEDYVLDLALRWTCFCDTRVVEVDEPATYRWQKGFGPVQIRIVETPKLKPNPRI